jgi:P-type Ca2+ transporter type 2C
MHRSFPRSRIKGLIENTQGLGESDVDERLRIYGQNTIILAATTGWRNVIRDTFRDPMVWFLIGTATLFIWLGNYTDAAVLAAALLPIVGMDAYLHRRTQATTKGLSGRLASHARVMRTNSFIEIPALDLLPGDLVLLGAGDAFPADGIIIGGDNLQVDESALTGESLPVRKSVFSDDLSGDNDVSINTVHWGTAGTRLLTGEAKLRIIYTGGETLYGQIARSAQTGKHERTPLQQAIGGLVNILIVVSTVLCLTLAAIRYHQGYGILDAILSAVTLAIAALPEEFPVVFTFFLGVGVYRLAKRQALVRRAVVVENIGRITCICTDKTGTLTQGRLQLAHILSSEGADDDLVIKVAATASRPESGDPLDTLLLKAAAPIKGTRLETYPFTEDRRREVAVIKEPSGAFVVTVKGAPETVFEMVIWQKDDDRDIWVKKTQDLAATGHKVIACAIRRLDNMVTEEPEKDYEFTGLLAFEDPVREGVAEAVDQAQAAGIRVIMVTGDHPSTARAIAKELGIGDQNLRMIEGRELHQYLDPKNNCDILSINVIARAIPSQKLDLVRALQRTGEIVAVTGDGVNDVPALQGADVGIAMGDRGTRTAREVASIVLLDDNFRTIVRAIAEGRQLFKNLKLSFAYLLMVHIPLVASAALIPLLGYPLLYLPVHIVWLELIIHPTALLVFQQLPASDDLEVIKRRSKMQFFDGKEWAIIGIVGFLISALIMLGYDYSLGADRDVVHARTMAMLALIIGGATVTIALSGYRSHMALIIVTATIGIAVIIIQYHPFADLVHLSPLHLTDWIFAALGGLLTVSFASLLPARQRRRKYNKPQ